MFSESVQNGLSITLYVCLGIFGFLLVGFITFFALQRNAYKRQYKLMKSFNHFNDNPIASNLKMVEYLVEKNKELKPLLDYFTNLNKTYREQMEQIKKQLMDLTKYNKRMHLIKIWKFMNVIESNLDILEEEEASFKILNIDTYSYTDNTSNIAIVLSNAVSKLESFLRDNNIKQQYYKSNDSLETVIKNIKALTDEINDKQMVINVAPTHHVFIKDITEIRSLYNLTLNYYYISRYQLLVKSMTNSFQIILKENKQNLTSKKIKEEIKKMIDYTQKTLNESNKALWNKDLEKSKSLLSELIQNIDECIADVSLEVKFQNLLDKTFSDFKKVVVEFVKKFNDSNLLKTYQKIAEDFTDYKNENNLLETCCNDANEVLEEINTFKKELSNKNLELKPTIENIIDIYNKILKFINENEKLYDILVNDLDAYFNCVVAVDNLILQLNFFNNFMKENNIKNTEIQHDIDNSLSVLYAFQQKFVKSKYIDPSITNKISQIENTVSETQESLNNYLILKELANRFMLYSHKEMNADPTCIAKASRLINEAK